MKKNKQLVLDVGNSRIKYGLFDENGLKKSGICTKWTSKQWNDFQLDYPFTTVLIGSVGELAKPIASRIPKTCTIHTINKAIQYPYTSAYNDLQTLGIDRRAALAGVMKTHPSTPVMIIDAGSCITYDFMNENAHHLGGAISPGRTMRYQAMHLFTAKLPLLNPENGNPEVGTTTQDSMRAGVEAGVVAEIQSKIDVFTQRFGKFTIILTGGDAEFLKKKIKNGIFADADLILKGLYHLLMFNSLHEK